METKGGSNAKEALKGYYFAYDEVGQQHKFKKTVEEIADYVGIVLGPEMRTLLKDEMETTYEDPTDPGKDATPGAVAVYKEEYKEVREDRKKYIRNKASVWGILYGQCTNRMKDAVKSASTFKESEQQFDVLKLLSIIKKLSYGMDDEQYLYWNEQAQMKKFYGLTQGANETLPDFTDRFYSQLEVTESVCGELTPRTMEGDTTEEGREKYLACVYMAAANRTKYKSTVDELCNDFQKAKDKTTVTFPETVEAAQKLLTRRRGTILSKKDDFDDGVLLLQFESKSAKKKYRGKCGNCNKWGHKTELCHAPGGAASAQADDNASTGSRSAGSRRQSGRVRSSAQFFQEYMNANISDR